MPGSGMENANNSSCVFFSPELQDRLPQRMCSRERRLPPSSNHRLCTPWQCQRWISQYNLICETKCLACSVGAVRSGTLKMATWGLDDVTWSPPSCYLLWSLELRVQFLWIIHGFLKYIAMKGSFLIQKCRNSGRKTAGITKLTRLIFIYVVQIDKSALKQVLMRTIPVAFLFLTFRTSFCLHFLPR